MSVQVEEFVNTMVSSGHLPERNGHSIYYETFGNPQGEPYIWFHGGPGGGINHKLLTTFDPEQHYVIAFDQRGCGTSLPSVANAQNGAELQTALMQHNDPDETCEDVLNLLDHLEIEGPVSAHGGSWGTTAAAYFAEKHPERVTKLVLRAMYTGRPIEVLWKGGLTLDNEGENEPLLAYGKQQRYPEGYEEFKNTGNRLLIEAAARLHLDPKIAGAAGANPILTYHFLTSSPDIMDRLPDIRRKAALSAYRYENSASFNNAMEKNYFNLPPEEEAKAINMMSLEMAYFSRFLAATTMEQEVEDLYHTFGTIQENVGEESTDLPPRVLKALKEEARKIRTALNTLEIQPFDLQILENTKNLKDMEIYIIHGEGDKVTFFQRGQEFASQCAANNAEVVLIKADTDAHSGLDPVIRGHIGLAKTASDLATQVRLQKAASLQIPTR